MADLYYLTLPSLCPEGSRTVNSGMIIQISSGACNCPLKVSAVTGMYGFNSTAKRQAMLQQIPITVLAWALETQETTSESKNFYKGESINKVNVSTASTQPL
jgi:hypothetical protein